jgi:hypothetical protein
MERQRGIGMEKQREGKGRRNIERDRETDVVEYIEMDKHRKAHRDIKINR